MTVDDIDCLIKSEKNKLELHWRMCMWCNYRCRYCCQGTEKKGHEYRWIGQVTQEKFAEKWVKPMIEKVGKPVHLILIGGEITYYNLEKIFSLIYHPNLVNINITTNLSNSVEYYKSLYKWCKEHNVKLDLMASYHPDQVDSDTFINKVKQLPRLKVSAVFDERWKDDIYRTMSALRGAYKIEIQSQRLPDFTLYQVKDEDKKRIDELNTTPTVQLAGNMIKVQKKDKKWYAYKSRIDLFNCLDDGEIFHPDGFWCGVGLRRIAIATDSKYVRYNNCNEATKYRCRLEDWTPDMMKPILCSRTTHCSLCGAVTLARTEEECRKLSSADIKDAEIVQPTNTNEIGWSPEWKD